MRLLIIHTFCENFGILELFVFFFQVMLKCSKPGKMYAIESETQNAGIPYADSFVVATHYCLNKVSETESSITVFSDIKYKKSVWVVKGNIALVQIIAGSTSCQASVL